MDKEKDITELTPEELKEMENAVKQYIENTQKRIATLEEIVEAQDEVIKLLEQQIFVYQEILNARNKKKKNAILS